MLSLSSFIQFQSQTHLTQQIRIPVKRQKNMNTFVRVFGIVSKNVEELLHSAMGNWPSNSRSCILFVDYSDFDILVGAKFTLFYEDDQLGTLHNINGELIQVTQSFLKLFDQ